MPEVARKYAQHEVADLVRDLNECYWGGFFKGGPSEPFVALATPNQKLLHRDLLLFRDSSEVTSEMIPFFFPLFPAITNPSSQFFTAMETFLFSPPFNTWLDSSNNCHDPATTRRFMDDWTPALRFFAKRFEIEPPNRYADAPEEVFQKYVEIERDCKEFLEQDAAQRSKNQLSAENLRAVFVDPVYAWMKSAHAFAYARCDCADGIGLKNRLASARKIWLPISPQEEWARLCRIFPELSNHERKTSPAPEHMKVTLGEIMALLAQRDVHATRPRPESDLEVLIRTLKKPTNPQIEIFKCLKGAMLTGQQLQLKLGMASSTFNDNIKLMMEAGIVKNQKTGVGYFRPDALPTEP